MQTEEEEDLVITLEGISTSTLAQLSGRFYRWLGKKLPLGADVRAIQVQMVSGVTLDSGGAPILGREHSLILKVIHVERQVVLPKRDFSLDDTLEKLVFDPVGLVEPTLRR